MVRILLKILDPTSIKLTMRYWLGLVGFDTFCTGTPHPMCHSGKSDVLFQNELMKLNTRRLFSLFMALNALAGISFASLDRFREFFPYDGFVNFCFGVLLVNEVEGIG